MEREIEKLSEYLREIYAQQIAEAPRQFKLRVAALFRRNLPPSAGRPTLAAVMEAIGLHNLGHQWKEIYPQVFPNHTHLDLYAQRQAESNLRAAVRSRRNTARRRKTPASLYRQRKS